MSRIGTGFRGRAKWWVPICVWALASMVPAAAAQRPDAESLDARLDAALQELGGLDALAASPLAPRALLIQSVVEGSQAARADVEAGWLILSCNGEALADHKRAWPRTDEHGDLFVVQRPDGEQFELIAEPGLIGVRHVTHRRPELWYLRHGQRDARWDREVVVASAWMERDPALALAAWDSAFAAGYEPDLFSHTCRFVTLAMSGRERDAYGLWVSRLAPAADNRADAGCWPTSRELLSVAAAAGDVAWYQSLAAEFEGLSLVPAELDGRVRARGDRRWAPDWSPLADGFVKVPANADIVPARFGAFGDRDAAKVRGGEPFLWSSRPGFFRRACFRVGPPGDNDGLEEDAGEPLRDFAWDVRFSVEPNGMPHPKWDSVLTFTVFDSRADADELWSGPNALVSLSIEHGREGPTYLIKRMGNLTGRAAVTLPAFRMDHDHPHDLQLVRVGSRVEVRLDGERVTAMTLPEEVGEPVFLMHSVGLSVRFESVEVSRLEAGAMLATRSPARASGSRTARTLAPTWASLSPR